MWLLLKPFLPFIATVAIILGGVGYIYHSGFAKAKAEAEHRQQVDALLAERKTRRIEAALDSKVAELDGKLGTRLEAINILRTTIIKPIQRELIDDPRYRSAECSLGVGVLRQVNAARAATSTTGTDGSITVALPPASDAH